MAINILLVGASHMPEFNFSKDNKPAIVTKSSKSLTATSQTHENRYKVSVHKGTKILIPDNINIRILLANNPIRLRQCAKNIHQQEDKVAALLALFIKAQSVHMQFEDSDIDNFVSFSSKILQSHVKDYKDYMQYLLDNEVFETDGYYIPDEKCLRFRLTEKYRYANLEEYFICNYNGNDKRGAAVQKSFFKPTKEQKETIGKHKLLYDDLCKVTVYDIYAAKDHILNELQDIVLDSVINDFKKRRDGQWTKYKAADEVLRKEMTAPRIIVKQNNWMSNLHSIHNGHFYFTQDKTSLRLHTSLLGVKAECRKFLRLEGKEIVSCDLKNSQPFISSFLFTKGELTPDLSEILNKCLSSLKAANYPLYESILKRIKQYKSGNILPSTQQYVELVKNGELYEFLAIKLNQINGEHGKAFKELLREDGKRQTFTLFFNPDKHNSLARDLFKINFPQVMSLFEDINILFTHTKKECARQGIPRQYNTLAILLQSIESHLFLEVICKNMKERYPHIPLLTLHDAIATNREYIETLKEEMHQTLNSNIGIEPTIKIEEWR